MIMAGYHNKPEATEQVIVNLPGRDGKTRRYFRTGDLGRIDADGYLFITGRKKDVFKVAGEMVSPREIEECLSLHPSVRGAAVVPKSDDVRGLIPVAFVEAHEGQTIDEAALRTWCRERLAGYKVPREVRVIAALPRNATGKILRRELKAD
jgi:long-chain acyl-CoA synthetase